MKSGASDPFGDSEDERSESSEKSSGERSDPRDSEDSEDERSESSEQSSGERSDPRDGEESESSESRTESEASRERADTGSSETPQSDPEIEGGAESEGGADAAEGDDPLSRDELPLVLRRDRVKDERPEVHQLFVQRGTHDRAVDAERELEDRLGVDLSRTDAREAIYLAGMAHLDDAEEILRTWGYDL